MTIPTAAEIMAMLRAATPRPTSEAPDDARGIYGLFDHTGAFRYIGSTSSASETFRKRIHQRHRTGSENSSHYFSRMHNTGRMRRQRNDPATPGHYASALRDLVASLTAPDGKPDNKARDAVRGLVSEIIVSRPENDGIPVEVRGRLSALITNSNFQVGGVMVAEEGLEPPTRGL